MKLCPACGADIIDSTSMKQCSSCGSDLEMTKVSRRSHRDADATIPDGRRNTLDDTKPILESDDLEVVHGDQAFWTEQEKGSSTVNAAPQAEGTQDAVKPTATAEVKDSNAPTLHELADRRKSSQVKGYGQGRTKSKSQQQSLDDRRKTGQTLDDTDPSGVKVDASSVSQKPPRPVSPTGVRIVAKSPSIAYLEDNKLSIPGAHWSAGQNLVISGETYQLKRKKTQKSWAQSGLFTALFGLIVGCVITLLLMGSDAPDAKIVGLIRDEISGNLLAGVRIANQEANQTAESNSEGVFIFDGLDEGVYTLVATDPIYGVSNTSVTITGDLATVLIGLQRPHVRLPPILPVQRKSSPSATKSNSGGKAAETSTRGKLAVSASESNAKIYIDGKTLGVGNSIYQRIRPGTRRIKIVRKGFKTWEKKVVIKAGKTTRIEPTLIPESAAEPVTLSPGQYAFAGRNFLEQHHYAGAIEQFGLAIKGDEAPQFYAWRAEAHAGTGNVSAAESDFLRSARLFQTAQRPDLLEKMLEVAVATLPSSANLRMEMGDLMYSRRRLGESEKHYRKALELGHHAGPVYIGIGLSLYAGGDYDGAVRSWEYADKATSGSDAHMAGYLILGHARLKHRASCRNLLKRLKTAPDVLTQFRAHPDWDRVQRLTGDG